MAFIQKLFSSYKERTDGETLIGEINRIWYDSNTNTLRISDGNNGGKIIGGSSMGSTVYEGPTPPPNPQAGWLWWDSLSGDLFVYYENNWVAATAIPNSTYTLPKATVNTLGGVEIGDNINIDGNGKISVTTGAGYSLPIATDHSLGGVEVGDNIQIDSVGKISVSFDGLATETYVNTQLTNVKDRIVSPNDLHTAIIDNTGTTTFGGDIIPGATTYNLGSATLPWKDVFVSQGSIVIADQDINTDAVYMSNTAGYLVLDRGGLKVTANDETHEVFQLDNTGKLLIKSEIPLLEDSAAFELIGNLLGQSLAINNYGVMIHTSGAVNVPNRMYMDAVGVQTTGVDTGKVAYSAFIGRSARGTVASPEAVQSGDIITRFGGHAYATTLGLNDLSNAQIDLVATQTQTSTARGTKIEIRTTANDTTTPTVLWTFGGDGTITFPNNTTQTTAWTGNADTVTNGVYLTDTQTLTNKTLTSPTITDGVFQDTFSIGNQIFYEHGYNGFSVNEDFDIVGEGNFTGYHYTSGAGRDGVAFTLARTGQFTTGFGIHGTSSANEYVIGSETANTDFVFKSSIGMPFDVSGGTDLFRISNDGLLTLADGTKVGAIEGAGSSGVLTPTNTDFSIEANNGQQVWTFGTDGTLTLPHGTNIGIIAGQSGRINTFLVNYAGSSDTTVGDGLYLNINDTGASSVQAGDIIISASGDTATITGAYPGSINDLHWNQLTLDASITISWPITIHTADYVSGCDVTIKTQTGTGWTFGTDGKLTLPLTGAKIANNVTFTGNVTFANTATYSQSTNTVYTDNILEIHAPPGGVGTNWTVDDGKDIGLRFHYYNGGDKNAALVFAGDSKSLEFYSTGYEGAGTFTGTYGTFKTGAVRLVNTATALTFGDGSVQNTAYTGTVAWSKITGAPSVTGYTGSAGTNGYTGSASTVAGYVGSVGYTGSAGTGSAFSTSTLVATAVTATNAGTAYATIAVHTAGTGLSGSTFNGSTAQTWTLNTATVMTSAVTAQNVAGGVGVYTLTAGTGTAVSASSGTVTIWATSVASSTGTTSTFVISNTLTSTSTTSGALQVAGGVGIAKDLFVGGNITATNVIYANTLTGIANTGSVQIQSFFNGTTSTWTFGSTASGSSLTFPDATVQTTAWSPANITTVTNTTAATSTATGALTVRGGVGIGGSMYVGGNLTMLGLDIAPANLITTTTNGTVTLSSVTSYNLVNATNGGISGQMNFPSSPVDGTIVRITSICNTSPTYNLGNGTFVPSTNPTFAYGSTAAYLYLASASTWYRIQ